MQEGIVLYPQIFLYPVVSLFFFSFFKLEFGHQGVDSRLMATKQSAQHLHQTSVFGFVNLHYMDIIIFVSSSIDISIMNILVAVAGAGNIGT